MKTIVVANAKGGCGKSLLIIGIASALHNAGKRVRIIDFDEQATIARWFDANNEGRYEKIPQNEIRIDHAFFSHDLRKNAHAAIAQLQQAQDEAGYDALIVDTKGETSILASFAMTAADLVLCPTDGSSPEFEPVVITYKTYAAALKKVGAEKKPKDAFHIVFSKQPQFLSIPVKDSTAQLKKTFKWVQGPGISSAYGDAHHHGATLGQMIARAQRAIEQSPDPTIRAGAKRAAEKYTKAIAVMNAMLAELSLLTENSHVTA